MVHFDKILEWDHAKTSNKQTNGTNNFTLYKINDAIGYTGDAIEFNMYTIFANS